MAKVYSGVSPDFVEEMMRWDGSLAGRVLRGGEPIVVEDISKEPGLTRVAANGEGLCSYIGVPLKSNGKVLGVMDVITRQLHRVAPRDKESSLPSATRSAWLWIKRGYSRNCGRASWGSSPPWPRL